MSELRVCTSSTEYCQPVLSAPFWKYSFNNIIAVLEFCSIFDTQPSLTITKKKKCIWIMLRIPLGILRDYSPNISSMLSCTVTDVLQNWVISLLIHLLLVHPLLELKSNSCANLEHTYLLPNYNYLNDPNSCFIFTSTFFTCNKDPVWGCHIFLNKYFLTFLVLIFKNKTSSVLKWVQWAVCMESL